jgi:hypothetical protein
MARVAPSGDKNKLTTRTAPAPKTAPAAPAAPQKKAAPADKEKKK